MRRVSLQAAEWSDLTGQFAIARGGPDDAVRRGAAGPDAVPSPTVADLLDPEGCGRYLDALTAALRSPSRAITASQFVKRYAALVVVPVLYTISRYDKAFVIPAEQCRIAHAAGEGKGWSPRVYLGDAEAVAPASDAQREAWLQAAGERLFAGHLEPLLRACSSAASISKAILWENAAVRVYSLYRKRLSATEERGRRERIAGDFDYWLHRAPAALFGEAYNPLQRFDGGMRRTCCLYYRVSAVGEYCEACPRAGR